MYTTLECEENFTQADIDYHFVPLDYATKVSRIRLEQITSQMITTQRVELITML